MYHTPTDLIDLKYLIAPSRRLATASTSITPSTPLPNLSVSLLLSRPPLLLRPPEPIESAYYSHSLSIRHALSNPTPLNFYFKPSSLALRRFQASEHSREVKIYGPSLAGASPDVGELPAEPPLPEARDWEKEDGKRGERSLERKPQEEIYCLVKTSKGWEFPNVGLHKGEGLDEAIKRGLVGTNGVLGGRKMDSWLVTRKPIGVIKSGGNTTFFLRSHIIAGEPLPSSTSDITDLAWLTPTEIERRLVDQGSEHLWKGVKDLFGISQSDMDLESLRDVKAREIEA
ncbi:hypothetical protein TREMEDRAFT_25833 [Tremella mesenterica DSM 1558]|uniref:uncharacterized protein n=1 Tax=Tremella mesenterica (strain ATCC 24925 / CBS 8224 / DSM 1558 / NBRC 9311 / NRRL Y-6157 / RJB 2259-6 / UBC 559-6) TaxID=578456 RepID=UPI0003F49E24|nr:uncharacterized protein TREMEDRAFT_25833 [Tremella mesenterica DSM 1558]EIW72818.1 hypothetical protein TREMEDRAFT_25833 [Tremella mesenterica DSM 1558]